MPEGIGYPAKTKKPKSKESKRQAFISAMKAGTKSPVAKVKAKPKKKVGKLRRRVKELIGGSKTYLPKKKKDVKTTRTKAVESGLAKAGVKGKALAKLRRRKK